MTQRGLRGGVLVGRSSIAVPILVMMLAPLALTGCGEETTRPQASGDRRLGSGASASTAMATSGALVFDPNQPAPVCSDSGAHGKHVAMGYPCATCHPCGYGLEIATVSLGRSTTTAGSVVIRGSGTPTTCETGCHTPLGATPRPVSWTAGRQACTDCHNNLIAGAVSAHPGVSGEGGDGCDGCHVTAAHTSGVVQLVGGGAGTEAMCRSCHSEDGATLLGITAPLLVGWTGISGDAHGERAGVGYGGTLLSPYVRGQSPISCTNCHDPHASANPYLLARAVNGMPVIAGQITRAGVGAEQLCQACHTGDRHAKCAECHGSDPRPPGSACLSCHTHQGSMWFPWPGGSPANYHDQSKNPFCDHCHDAWSTQPELVPPAILNGESITVAALETEATISWQTNERATSYVEYGVTERNRIAGDPYLSTQHSVRLTGLAGNTTYTFRVRSSDANRNVTVSSVRSFMTECATCPVTPIEIANGNFDSPVTATQEQSGGWWRYADEATYCGQFASSEMTGANVLRIAASPITYWDDDLGDDVTYGGYGWASYGIPRAALDAGKTVTFDLRPKYIGPSSSVTLSFVALDASGVVITNSQRAVYDLVGVSSTAASSTLRIVSPAVNTTYQRTVDVRAAVANALVSGRSWGDVAKVWLVLQATSGQWGGIDVYFDSFR